MSLEKQLGKGYEERLLNYLLHRRENYVLEVNLRHIAKAFGWTGKSKLVRQALEQLASQGKVKKVVYQTGIVHWSIADVQVVVLTVSDDTAQWQERYAIPAWHDVQVWAQETIDSFNRMICGGMNRKLIKAEVL